MSFSRSRCSAERSPLDLAHIAAVSARRRLGRALYEVNQVEFEDWVGTAALGIAVALHRQPDASEAYLIGAGRRECICWLMRSWWRGPKTTPLPAWDDGEEQAVELAERASGWELSEGQLLAIWRMMYEARSKRGVRGEMATDRDLAILVCLLRGWGNAEIARELGLTADHIKKYRQQIVRRLESIAAQRTAIHCTAEYDEPVVAGSCIA
jgi:DNA-binding CsgD family transcriptional regulator